MTLTLAIVILVIVVALVFDYTNGFHDAANAIATSVATRALTPQVALVLAALMNVVGALLGETIAKTVADVVVLPSGAGDAGGSAAHHGLVLVMAALVGAIVWNLVTWRLGLPSSSTHALIGGLVGAGLAGGVDVRWGLVVKRVLVPLLLSPVVGFVLAFVLMLGVLWAFRRGRPHVVFRGFRIAQTFSTAALALGHGLQDAQKTMGVILLTLVVAYPARYDLDHLPMWVVLASAAVIGLGTYAGGWRIIRTVGRRIVHLDPARGFAAEAVGAGVLYTSTLLQAPVSTTHTITSALAGTGTTQRLSAVRWNVVGTIALGWLLTFPAAALLSAATYALLHLAFLS